MTKELEIIESLEQEAKLEIANLLMLDQNILDDVKINVGAYRVDIEICRYPVFILSNSFGDVKYSTSVYSSRMTADSDKDDRVKYQKIVSVFIKLLDLDVSEKTNTILEKYRQLAINIEKA